MGFIEEEKRRLKEKRRKEKKEKKLKEKKLKEKKKCLNKKAGQFTERLLKKINEKQKDARLHGIHEASNSSEEWKWKINYNGSEENLKLELCGKRHGTKIIICLIDESMHMSIKAVHTGAPYLSNGYLKIDIKEESFLDYIADIILELRYTGKCERLESSLLINSNLLKRISSKLKEYDDLIDKEKRKKKEINKKKYRGINISILVGVILGIIVSTICLANASWLGFGCIIIGGISGYISFWIAAFFVEGIFGYSDSKQHNNDRDELRAIRKQINKIRDYILNCLKGLQNSDYKSLLQPEEYILELPLERNLLKKEDLISEIYELIKNSKYEK